MNKKQRYKEALRALPKPEGVVEPTLPERINRLSPSERYDLSRLIRSMKLRKIIRRTLAEAFWNREADEVVAARGGTMARLRAAVRTQESMRSYEQALTSFEPVITQSQQPTLIERP